MLNRRTFLKSGCLFTGSMAFHRTQVFGRAAFPMQETPPLYRFMYCNDTHVISEADAEHFRVFIDDANTVPDLFDFLVVCGDLGNEGTEEELLLSKRELDRLKKPYYTVIGNHDVLQNKDKNPYRAVFGNDRENYVVQHKGTGLIYMDLTDGHSSNVTVLQETVDWLETTLADLDQTLPLLVFTHFPLHEGAPQYTAADSNKLFNLLDSRTVLGYFNGHWHGKWKGERNGIDFYCNACMSNSRNNFTWGPDWYKQEWENMTEGFLLVEVFADGVGTTFFEYGEAPAVEPLPSFSITFPGAGDALKGGEAVILGWSSTGTVEQVNLSYSSDSGLSWVDIASSIPNDHQYEWSVPKELEEQEILLRVADAAWPSIYFQTAGPFKVEKGTVGILNSHVVTAPGNSRTQHFLANGKRANGLKHRHMYTINK